ncbi:hypothetical protein V6N12_062879 [Hibiscus sabdariffa]|uniref:RNase H type-1 domain-containing protein n=1 Tax=Hibiscus sabdariffa TaxID=183260 RepID=A0ABR2FA77_9ROSI
MDLEEFLALELAIEVFIKTRWMGVMKLVLVSNSRVVLNWIENPISNSRLGGDGNMRLWIGRVYFLPAATSLEVESFLVGYYFQFVVVAYVRYNLHRFYQD